MLSGRDSQVAALESEWMRLSAHLALLRAKQEDDVSLHVRLALNVTPSAVLRQDLTVCVSTAPTWEASHSPPPPPSAIHPVIPMAESHTHWRTRIQQSDGVVLRSWGEMAVPDPALRAAASFHG